MPRHRQVEQQQRRLRRADDADGLLAAAGFAHDLESRADVDAVNVLDHRGRHRQQLAQARAEQALVVRQDDADRVDPAAPRRRAHVRTSLPDHPRLISVHLPVAGNNHRVSAVLSSCSVNGLAITALNP